MRRVEVGVRNEKMEESDKYHLEVFKPEVYHRFSLLLPGRHFNSPADSWRWAFMIYVAAWKVLSYALNSELKSALSYHISYSLLRV